MPETSQSIETPDGGEILTAPRTQAINVLSVLRDGQIPDLLTLEFQRAVLAINASQSPKAKAKITLEIELEKHGRIIGGLVTTAEVKSKLPKEAIPADMLFGDEDGNLLTRHPNQRDMFERPKGA